MIKPCPVCASNQISPEITVNQFELVKCSNCEFVFVNLADQDILKHNSDYDDDRVAIYEQRQTLINELWFQRIVNAFSSSLAPGKVLDVGCGNGELLKKFIDQGWDAYGVDVSPWSINFADQYGFKLYQTTIEAADIPAGYFDLVVSTSTLEHIAQPKLHVQAILKVLKPGGVAYFSGIPNYGKIFSGRDIFFEKNSPPGHVNYFSANSMRSLFSQPNLSDNLASVVVNTYGFPYLHIFYHFILKLIRRTKKQKKLARQPAGVEASKFDNGQSQSHPSDPIKERAAKVAAAKLFVSMNYLFGKINKFGDKLEAIITVK